MTAAQAAGDGIHVFMELKLKTVVGELTALFVSPDDALGVPCYTAWFLEQPITVEGSSVADCIDHLHDMLEWFMIEIKTDPVDDLP